MRSLMKRKRSWGKLLPVACIMFALALGNVTQAAPNTPIKVGLVQAFTGTGVSVFEEEVQRGILMAVSEINEKGGVKGHPIRLIMEDTAGTTNGALAGFEKIVAEHKDLAAVIGSYATFIIRAMLPKISEAKIPFLCGPTNGTITREGCTYLFRFNQNDDYNAAILARFVVEDLKCKDIAILHDSDEMGTRGAQMLQKTLREVYNITPLTVKGWSSGDKDFSAQLLAASRAGAKTILGWNHITETALMLRQMHELGLDKQFEVIAGTHAYSDPYSVPVGPQYYEDVYSVVAQVAENPVPEIQAFREKYKARYKKEPTFNTMSGYDVVHVLAMCLEKLDQLDPPNREQLRAELTKVRDYPGLLGVLSCDKYRDMLHSAVVSQIRGGASHVIKVVSVPNIEY